VLYSQQVLAVLVRDRQRAIAEDRAFARRMPLRRSVASLVSALGAGLMSLGDALDDEPALGGVTP
jgi:hypothetical protein